MNIHSVSSRVNIRSHQVSTRMSIIPSRLLMWEFDVWTLWVGKGVVQTMYQLDNKRMLLMLLHFMLLEYICGLGEEMSFEEEIIK